jgi:hypothetical protein
MTNDKVPPRIVITRLEQDAMHKLFRNKKKNRYKKKGLLPRCYGPFARTNIEEIIHFSSFFFPSFLILLTHYLYMSVQHKLILGPF